MPLSFSLQNKAQLESNEIKPESTKRDNGDMECALYDIMCGGCTCGGGLSEVSDDELAIEIKEDDTPKSPKSNKHFPKLIPMWRQKKPIEMENTEDFF
jgi:hypothetical protein